MPVYTERFGRENVKIIKAAKFTKMLILRASPGVIYNTIREDIRRAKEAKSLRDEDIHRNSITASSIRLKLLASTGVSEICGTYVGAPLIGIAAQYATGNAYNGIIGTIIGDYLPALVSFQASWLWMNSGYYKEKTERSRISKFYLDVAPALGVSAMASVPAYALSGGLTSLAIAAGNHVLGEKLMNELPSAFLTGFGNIILAETVYLTIVLSFNDSVSRRITKRYEAYLERKYGEK